MGPAGWISRPAYTVALFVLGSLLSGCLGGSPIPAPVTEADTDATARSNVTVNLSQVPEGSEWVLLELSTRKPSPLTGWLDMDIDLVPARGQGDLGDDRHQEPRAACVVAQLGFGTVYVLDPGRHGVSTRPAVGPEATVTAAWPFGEGESQISGLHLLEEKPRDRVPVLLGLDDRRTWGEDAQVTLTVGANTTVDWRIVDHGQITCVTHPEDFQRGTFTEASLGLLGPDVQQAWGLASTHAIRERGVGFVFLQANLEYHAVVLEGEEVAWETQGEPEGEFHDIRHRLNLSQGPAEIRVPRLSSTDTAHIGYVLLDLPPWAAHRFQEAPDRFEPG